MISICGVFVFVSCIIIGTVNIGSYHCEKKKYRFHKNISRELFYEILNNHMKQYIILWIVLLLVTYTKIKY